MEKGMPHAKPLNPQADLLVLERTAPTNQLQYDNPGLKAPAAARV